MESPSEDSSNPRLQQLQHLLRHRNTGKSRRRSVSRHRQDTRVNVVPLLSEQPTFTQGHHSLNNEQSSSSHHPLLNGQSSFIHGHYPQPDEQASFSHHSLDLVPAVPLAPAVPLTPYVYTAPSPAQPSRLYGFAVKVLLFFVVTIYIQSPLLWMHYSYIRTAGSYISHSPVITAPRNFVNRVQHVMTLEARVRGIEYKLFQYSRGGVARPDFASRYAGAQVLDDLTTSNPPELNTPYIALDDDLRVGSCWRLPQINGQIGILLSRPTTITHMSIDHIPRELVMDVMHAPRDILLWGVVNSSSLPLLQFEADPIWDKIPRRSPNKLKAGLAVVPLATVRYDITGPHFIQTFNVSRSVSTHPFSTVIVDILNNWGADYTCLYRIRIHGEAAL